MTKDAALYSGQARKRLPAQGNQAVASDAVEAGVRLATGSTDIVETWIDAAPALGFSAVWSVKEKVAFGVATGPSFASARARVVTRHVGRNVAADFLLQLNRVDIAGGWLSTRSAIQAVVRPATLERKLRALCEGHATR